MRDVNNLSHWALNSPQHFDTAAVPTVGWDTRCNALGLVPAAKVEPSSVSKRDVRRQAARPPMAVDAFGTWARIGDRDDRFIDAGGAGIGTERIFDAGEGMSVLDFDCSVQGDLLVITRESRRRFLHWSDRQGRFAPLDFELGPNAFDRISAAPDMSAIWLLNRRRARLTRVDGAPVPRPISAFQRPGVGFDPNPIAPNPPRLTDIDLNLPEGEPLLDMVALNDEVVVFLREGERARGASRLEWRWPDGRVRSQILIGVTRAFSICAYGGDRVALVAPDWREARVYTAPDPDAPDVTTALPGPERIPLRGWTGERLCRGCTEMGHYPVKADPPCARLSPLSYASFARGGVIDLSPIDAGEEGFVWHRIYLEADLPRGCAIVLELEATEDGVPTGDMHSHIFGEVTDAQGNPARGVWVDMGSEHAHGRNHLPVSDRIKDRLGLFSCLVQADRPGDSRIKGRHLHMRLRLIGTGAATPRLFAMRVWGPRFSYREKYLPELYTITEGPGAEGSDFLERFLGLFEGVLTPLEAQIAETWRGASAGSAPVGSLDWLGGWLGLSLDPALGETGKRRTIARAADQSLWHGTLRGLEEALDIATDGGVRTSRIVVVENFMLRRTFATILGADFDDTLDPMTRGTRANANSVLGPNFHLGHEDEKRLFALFRPDVLEHDLTSMAERAEAASQLAEMEDDAAFRVTVLVHETLSETEAGLVRNTVARAVPAHVHADIFEAPGTLLLGLNALLGVETRLGADPGPRPFTLNATELGQSRLRGLPALDPRLEP